MYLSIGNHESQGRDMLCGKRLLQLIRVPVERLTDAGDDYKLAMRTVFHAHWDAVLRHINFWKDGFYLKMPSWEHPRLVVPRIGLIIGDLVELWMVAGVLQSRSVRCGTPVDKSAKRGSNLTDDNLNAVDDIRAAVRTSTSSAEAAAQPPSCVFTKSSQRRGLLLEWPYAWSVQNRRKGDAREAFRRAGFAPFVDIPWERPEYEEIMGSFSMYQRMPSDFLHQVC